MDRGREKMNREFLFTVCWVLTVASALAACFPSSLKWTFFGLFVFFGVIAFALMIMNTCPGYEEKEEEI